MTSVEHSRLDTSALDPFRPGPAWLDVLSLQGEAGCRGSALVAPTRIDLTEHSELPFALVFVLDEQPEFPATSATAVLVTRLESRTTWCVPLREPRERPARPREDDDGGFQKPGVTVGAAHFNLRDRIPDLPWRPGTLVMRLVRNGAESNTVTVVLDAGALSNDESARAILDHRRAPALPEAELLPAAAEVGWSAETPMVPPPDGLVMRVVASDLVSNPPVIFARGSYTVPARQIEIVPPEHPVRSADGRIVVARLPLALVVTGPELLEPVVIRVRLDSHLLVDADGWRIPLPEGDRRTRMQGQFNLNLGAFWEFPRVPGRYWVRAIVGAFDSGPLPYTVLDANLAPLVGDEPA